MSKNSEVRNVTPMKLIPVKDLDKAIALMHKQGQSLQKKMHVLACSVLAAVGETHDVRIAHKFVQAMPEMSRTNGLRNWFEQFGPIKFIVDADTKIERVQYVKGGKFKLGDAMAKPFWKFSAKEGKPYEAIDLDKWVQATLSKLEKDAKETGRDHSALIAAVKAAAVPAEAVQQ